MRFSSLLRTLITGAFWMASLSLLVGCRGKTSQDPPLVGFPNMNQQDKCKPQGENHFFKDGRCNRPHIDGTVPWEPDIVEGGGIAYNTGIMEKEVISPDEVSRASHKFVPNIPTIIDPVFISKGREKYNTFCSPCHDRLGQGQGLVIQRAQGSLPPPPSLHDPELSSAHDGYLFYVITHGKGAMKGYGSQTTAKDRWQIVAYIRALQLSQNPSEYYREKQ